MSITFDPEEMPTVEKRGPNEYFCSSCRTTFSYEDFAELGGGCPGCERMRKAQQNVRGAL